VSVRFKAKAAGVWQTERARKNETKRASDRHGVNGDGFGPNEMLQSPDLIKTKEKQGADFSFSREESSSGKEKIEEAL